MRSPDRTETTLESEPVLDDIEARPGSTVSLLRTVIGLYLRDVGGWVATKHLVALLRDVGISEQATRNAVSRIKGKALLIPETRDTPGYRLNPRAIPMLERGDRRIFRVRAMRAGDPWCLISFTVAERRRDVRHQLRRRLQWIGCGTVAPGLWIAPETLRDEILVITDTLDVQATLFETGDPHLTGPGRGSFADAVNSWWDLDALRAAHQQFLQATAKLPRDPQTDTEAFAAYVRLVDEWRLIPYIDPGLPRELLPGDWPGDASAERFTTMRSTLEDRAHRHVGAVLQ